MRTRSSGRILLVDDDRFVARLVTELVKSFRGLQFRLDIATTMAGGLEAVARHSYDLVLLDYMLPDGNGLDFLAAAKACGNDTPTIFLTGNDDEALDAQALEAGAVDFLEKKELSRKQLEHSVRYATRLSETLRQLKALATRDHLTGLLNRREFDRQLGEEVTRSSRFKRPLCLVLIDIDHFKKVNDTYGHAAGDEVLRHVSALLTGQLREVDRVARYGGEEIAVIMAECFAKDAVQTMQRLQAILADNPCVVPGQPQPVAVTFSAGVASAGPQAGTPAEMAARADLALYAAKKGGRNRVIDSGTLPAPEPALAHAVGA